MCRKREKQTMKNCLGCKFGSDDKDNVAKTENFRMELRSDEIFLSYVSRLFISFLFEDFAP